MLQGATNAGREVSLPLMLRGPGVPLTGRILTRNGAGCSERRSRRALESVVGKSPVS